MLESKSQLENILQTAMDGFWRASKDGRLLSVNRAYCQMSGYCEQELLSMSVADIESAESIAETEAHLKRIMAEGGDRFESRHRRKDGSVFDVEISAQPGLGDSEEMVVFIRDITERKQAEEKLLKSETAVQNKLKAISEPQGDLGTLELSDILDLKSLESMLEDFYQLTGMLGAVLDLSGKVMVAVGWQDICTKFHRCHPDTLKNCIESDTLLTQDVPVGTFKHYRCKNNMWDMVTPLEVGGRHVGNVFIGQFFYEDEIPDIDLFRSQARRYGFDEEEYLEALERVPRFSKETVNTGMRFYAKLAKMFSSMSFSALEQSKLLDERNRAMAEINKIADKFRLMIDMSPLAIYMSYGIEQKAEYINPTFIKLFGYTLEEVPSVAEWWPLAYPDARYRQQIAEEWQARVAYAIRTNTQTEPFETVVTCKDGSTKNISWGFVSSDVQNWSFGLDLTERKRAEAKIRQLNVELEQRVLDRTEELNKSKKLLDETGQLARIGGWEFDVRTDELTWTKETYLIHEVDTAFQPTLDSAVGFYPPEALPIISEAVNQALGHGSPFDLELPLDTAKGNRIMIRSLGKAYRENSEIVKIGGVIQDISERVKAEAELRELNSSLNLSNTELEAFSYSVSHDLRAPLRALSGFSAILTAEHSAALDAEGARLLQNIAKNANKMGQLVDDLLAFSQLSRQKMSLSHLDMHDLVRGLCDELIPETDAGKIELRLQNLPPATGDPTMIRQVWQNLIDNALKYTSGRATRIIEIGSYVEGTENVYFIKDNGVGFDMKYGHKLYGVFQRLHSDLEFEGTGVGLAIVQRIVQRQKGRLWAEGKVAEGATFYFTLPS